MSLWPPCRDLKSSITAVCKSSNHFSTDFVRHLCGMITNRLRDITSSPSLRDIFRNLNQRRIFNSFNNLSHLLNYLYRKIPDRKSTRLNSSHVKISYAVFCLKKKKKNKKKTIE